mgnify:FL=1
MTGAGTGAAFLPQRIGADSAQTLRIIMTMEGAAQRPRH